MNESAKVLQGSDVRGVFEAILPEEALRGLIAKAGFQTRQRTLDGLEFVRAMEERRSLGAAL